MRVLHWGVVVVADDRVAVLASMVNPGLPRILEATGAVPPFFVVAFENKIALRTLFERLKAAEPVAMPEGKVSGMGQGKGNSPQPPTHRGRRLGV